METTPPTREGVRPSAGAQLTGCGGVRARAGEELTVRDDVRRSAATELPARDDVRLPAGGEAVAGGGAVLRAVDAEAMVVRCRAELRRRGVRAGDRVALVAPNSPEFAATLLALVALDASIVLGDSRQTPEQFRQTLSRSRASWVLADTAGTPAALRAAADAGHTAGVTGIGVTGIGATGVDGPAAGATVGSPTEPVTGPAARPAVQVIDIRDACHRALGDGDDPAEPVRFDRWRERRDGLVLWSSGSTGRPKGIVRSGAAMLVNTGATQRAMRYRPDDVLMPLLPFSHQYGMSLVLLWWQVRCSLVIAPYQRLSAAAELIAAHGVTVVDAAPPTYDALLRLFDRKPGLRETAGSVRMWCVGGAPLPAPLAERFRSAVGLPLLDGYGLSELGNVALAVPEQPLGCGRPLDGVRLRIDVPRDGIGEVLVHSPGLMTGYLSEDGELRPAEPGWFRTGDLGMLADDGSLQVIGRRQAVHRMGYTLYPESLRRQAEACGQPVAVIAVEDERRGCRLVFFVEDAARRDARYWRARLEGLLAAYERPNLVEVVEHFPLTRTGKVDRAQLTTTAAERLSARQADGERP